MKLEESAAQATVDLIALAAVAHGRMPDGKALSSESAIHSESARLARIAELKAQYAAGILPIEVSALANKLVDRMLSDFLAT